MSRTTSSSAWKPPGSDGTTSQERAKRYIKASEGSPDSKEDKAPVKRSSVARGPRGSVQAAEGPTKGPAPKAAAKGPSPAARRAKAAAEDEEEEIELDEEFAASWNYFERHANVPAGSLRRLGDGGALPGMSHPPQNPKIQKELMMYFQKHGTPAVVESRPVRVRRRRDLGASGTEGASAAPGMPSSPARSVRSLPSAGSSPTGKKSGVLSSAGSSWTLPWAPDLVMPGAKRTAPGGAQDAAEKGAPSSAELWAELRDAHSKDQAVPPPVSFLEVGRWSRELSTKSRFHGFELSQRTTEDVSDLAMYHNSLSRSASPKKEMAKTMGASASSPALGRSRSRGFNAASSNGFGGGSLRPCSSSYSLGCGSTKQSFFESLDSVRAHSPEKLRAKAEAALRAGPSRLQFLSEVTRVSTATGAAPHRSRLDYLYGPAPPPEE